MRTKEQFGAFMPSSEKELIAAAARGEAAAFGEIYRRYGGRVYDFAYRMLGPRSMAIDIPRVGRVILTLAAPSEEAGFQRAAVVGDHQIVFTIGADQYEWLSPQRIAPGSGIYYGCAWIRLFRFLFQKQKLEAGQTAGTSARHPTSLRSQRRNELDAWQTKIWMRRRSSHRGHRDHREEGSPFSCSVRSVTSVA